MSVLDVIDAKKKEIQALRDKDGTAYLKRMAEGVDHISGFLEHSTDDRIAASTSPESEAKKKSASSTVISDNDILMKLANYSSKSLTELHFIYTELKLSREASNRELLKNQSSKYAKKPVANMINQEASGGILDLLPDSGGKGKLATAGKWLGRAGGLAMVAGGAYAAYNALGDDSLSDKEKTTKVGGAVGATAGGLGGMAAGAATGAAVGALFGGVGAVPGSIIGGLLGGLGGGALGDVLGESIGSAGAEAVEEFTSYMHNELGPATAKIMSSLSKDVTETTDKVEKGFDDLKTSATDAFKGLGESASTITAGFRNGINAIIEGIKGSKDKAVEVAGKAVVEATARGATPMQATNAVIAAVVKNAPSIASPIVTAVPKAITEVSSGVKLSAQQVAATLKGEGSSKLIKGSESRWQEHGQNLTEAAMKYGIDPKQFAQTAYVESAGFNNKAKAGTSSASGLLQFLDGTWVDTVKKHGRNDASTAKLADLADIASKRYGGKNGFNKDAARDDPELKELFAAKEDSKIGSIMGAAFTADNIKMLSKAGVDNASSAEMYSAHFLGNAKLAATARTNPNMTTEQMIASGVVSSEQIKANKSVFEGKANAGDVMSELNRRVNMGSKFGDSAQQIASTLKGSPINSATNVLSAGLVSSSRGPATIQPAPASTNNVLSAGFVSNSLSPIVSSVSPVAQAVASPAQVDQNPINTTANVNVSQMPITGADTGSATGGAQTGSTAGGNGGSGMPRMSDIPIHITDQGLVLIQTGIV
jgi:hypothetical protein